MRFAHINQCKERKNNDEIAFDTWIFTGKVVVVTGAGGVLCGEMAQGVWRSAGAKVAAAGLE